MSRLMSWVRPRRGSAAVPSGPRAVLILAGERRRSAPGTASAAPSQPWRPNVDQPRGDALSIAAAFLDRHHERRRAVSSRRLARLRRGASPRRYRLDVANASPRLCRNGGITVGKVFLIDLADLTGGFAPSPSLVSGWSSSASAGSISGSSSRSDERSRRRRPDPRAIAYCACGRHPLGNARAGVRGTRPKWQSGSTASARAGPRAAPTCAAFSAARAPTSPRCAISACRCRPASPSPPRSAPTTTPTAAPTARPQRPGGLGARRAQRAHRPLLRRRGSAAPPLGPLGRARLDAGNDGHRPQSRPQRRDRRSAGQGGRQALRLRFLPPLHPDVCRRGARRRPAPLRGAARRLQGRARFERSTPTSAATIGPKLTHDYKVIVDARARHRLPERSQRAALGRHRRRLRLVDEPARHRLPPHQRDPGRLGHGGQRPGHGLRQHGRELGTGVAFTRNPSTGEKELYGEYLSTPRARTSSPASARRRS